jgi:hypothetical protein
MFQIKNIHYNPKTEFIYLICLSQTGLYYCSIYKRETKTNWFDNIYFIGYKTKDTDYKLNNPTDITIHPITNDIAIAEYNKGIIRLYSGSNYKFIKNYGSIESFENNSSNSNSNSKYKTTNMVSTIGLCAYSLRSFYRGLTKYKLSNITSIKYSLDCNSIFIVDTNGISILKTDTDILCSIIPTKINKSTLKTDNIYPYKLEVINDTYIGVSFSNLNNIDKYYTNNLNNINNNVFCHMFKVINYNSRSIIYELNYEFTWVTVFERSFSYNNEIILYIYNQNLDDMVIKEKTIAKKLKGVNNYQFTNDRDIPYKLSDNKNQLLPKSKSQIFFVIGKGTGELFILYNNNILINHFVTGTIDNPGSRFQQIYIHDEKIQNTDRLKTNVRKSLKQQLKSKLLNTNYNNNHNHNHNIIEKIINNHKDTLTNNKNLNCCSAKSLNITVI